MRFHCLWLLLLSAPIASCAADKEDLAAKQASCDIASDYAQRFVTEAESLRAEDPEAPKSIAVREAPYQLMPVVTKDGPAQIPVTSSISEVSDWDDIQRLSDKSIITACPGLTSWLSDRDVISDDETIRSLSTGDDWEVHVLSMAMPIFTADGERAVIFAEKVAGGLAGVGTLGIYAKNDDGKWQLVGEEIRWVS